MEKIKKMFLIGSLLLLSESACASSGDYDSEFVNDWLLDLKKAEILLDRAPAGSYDQEFLAGHTEGLKALIVNSIDQRPASVQIRPSQVRPPLPNLPAPLSEADRLRALAAANRAETFVGARRAPLLPTPDAPAYGPFNRRMSDVHGQYRDHQHEEVQ